MNCTNYVAWHLGLNSVSASLISGLGNGSTWAQRAASQKHLLVNGMPAVGSIAQWVGGNHVAYVEKVNSNGTIQISESNVVSGAARHWIQYRTIAASSVDNFIHFGGTVSNAFTWVSAFQANTGNLFVVTDGNMNTSFNTGQGMAAGTNPGVAKLTNGSWAAVFQANTGVLHSYSLASGSSPLNQGMATGASPSIAALSGGSWVSAFRANTGELVIYSPSFPAPYSHNTHIQVKAGTNPAIAGNPSANGWTVAYQGADGLLYTYDHLTQQVATGWEVAAGTSPSIVFRSNGTVVIALAATTGGVIIWWPGGAAATYQPISAGTSPAIAVAPDGTNYAVAYQGSDGALKHWTSNFGNWSTSQGMLGGTSPAVRYLADGSIRASFQANVGELYEYTSNSGSAGVDLNQGMAPGTSPAID